MGRIMEALMKEANGMEMDSTLRGMTPVNTMIIMQLKTGSGSFHTHFRMPPTNIAMTMLQELEEKIGEKSPLILPKRRGIDGR